MFFFKSGLAYANNAFEIQKKTWHALPADIFTPALFTSLEKTLFEITKENHF